MIDLSLIKDLFFLSGQYKTLLMVFQASKEEEEEILLYESDQAQITNIKVYALL